MTVSNYCAIMHLDTKGGERMQKESRAEYFRERRKKFRQLVFVVDNAKADKLDEMLQKEGKTRSRWFREVLDEKISQK